MAHDVNTSLAVLIDADNANPAIVEGLLTEIATLGVASVKRIYGDWTTPNLGTWKKALLEHSIQPIQQFSYTSGKNATDSAMIIDAMDLLYTKNFGGFCLVSSDSDFTKLAARLRETGCVVYGFGEQKTPRPFVSACDRFIYTEVFLIKPDSPDTTSMAAMPKRSNKELRGDTALLRLIRSSIEARSDESGWASLSQVGALMSKTANDFDPRTYGYAKLSGLLQAIGLFDIERRESHIYIKDQKKKAGATGAENQPSSK